MRAILSINAWPIALGSSKPACEAQSRSSARVRPRFVTAPAQGDCRAFGFNRRSDHLHRRCHLLLGHRQVRQRWSSGKPSQTAGGAGLPGSDSSKGSSAGRNQLVVADFRLVTVNTTSFWRCSSRCRFVDHANVLLIATASIMSHLTPVRIIADRVSRSEQF
jgi:hypothetical protein